MSNKVRNYSNSNVSKSNSSQLVDAAHDAITSGNPVKIIGGIALGVIAVGGMAIWAISKQNR